MATFGAKLKHAWNAFISEEQTRQTLSWTDVGASYGTRPDRVRLRYSSEKSIISSIYTRLGIDVAGIAIKHVRVDDAGQYSEDMVSGLENCLTVSANIDQGARAFRQDIAMTMFDKGVAAIVPVDTTLNPLVTGGYDITTMRVGEIVAWYPRHVRVNLYNEARGMKQEITVPKNMVAIVENPFYTVMNEPNSTLQRLIRKLNLLDAVDEQSGSGKLDMIIQLPYVIKSEARKQQAEERRTAIETQLKGSQYGIAYADGTEKITQLNRPVENNLMAQVEYLTTMLYGQLGITADVMNGTADEATMLGYYNRTIEPIMDAIVEAMKRTFLTSTARTQNQSIQYFRDAFKLVPLGDLAEIVDKLSRNEVVTPNEFRSAIGLRPSKDPKADQLQNSNMPQPPGASGTVDAPPSSAAPPTDSTTDQSSVPGANTQVMAQSFDAIDSAINDAFSGLGVDQGADNASA